MSFLRRLANLGRSNRLERDIDREMSFHIRERVEELENEGMSEADALAAAHRQFGNRTYRREEVRDADIITWLDSFLGDIRYGLRALRRTPVFTTVAIASLALGMGATTAIYTLIDAVVVRPLPVPHPEELVQVTTGDDDREGYFTNPMWEEVRNRQTGFTAIAAFGGGSFNIADGGEVRPIQGHWVGGDFFNLFGMQSVVGRLFARADDVRGCSGIAVLGYGFWQSEYGGQREVVGKTISLAGKPFQIIGVASPGFSGPVVGRDVQLYAPLCAEAFLRGERSSLDARSNWWLRVIGRRDPELSLAQVVSRLKAIAPASYAATVPPRWAAADKLDYQKRTFSAISAEHGMSEVRSRYATALKILMGAVALVLLIACANVANLLLARAAVRQREVAIRLAIGAARRRLVRQLLTESALLALLGAVVGLAVAHWGTRALVALISTPGDPVSLDLTLNLRVLGFTALVATATATLFGLIPAWRGTKVSPQTAMKANGRGVVEGTGHGRVTIGKALVAVQVALSLTLLAGAGLLVGSLHNLTSIHPGFRAEGVLIASVGFDRTGIPVDQRRAVQRGLLEQVRALPGVRSASASDLTPVGGMSWNDRLYVDGYTPKSERDALAWFNEVSEGYFATMETKVVAGRDFDRTDVPGGVKTAVINESTARKFFGSASPLGRQLRTKRGDTFSEPLTVVGVVEDAKYRSLREESSETVYLPASQNAEPGSGMTMELRTDGNPMTLVPAVKRLVANVHQLASMEFRTLSDQLAASLQRERMLALLSAAFGGVALALSMLGLYGVMAYTVARRRNEIGVRIALGADKSRVLRLVLGDVARVVTIGLVLGAAGAVASGKLVSAFLFGLTPSDPRVLGVAAIVLAIVALGAGFIPALRATRVDPVAALRED